MGDLAKRLAAGDEAAFTELFDTCAGRLLRWLSVRLPTHGDAEDVVQETFVRVARSRERLGSVDNMTAYVFQIARNECARTLERRDREARRRALRVVDAEPATPDPGDAGEVADSLRAALTQLSPPLREVIELKVYGEMTFREVAEILGLPQGTVATRYRSAMEQMRQVLAKEFS